MFQEKRKKRQLEKLYSGCEDLPIWNFLKIAETNNLYYLVKNNARVDSKLLYERWNDILKEFEGLTGSSSYSMQLLKKTNDLKKINRLNGLISLYYLAEIDSSKINLDEELKAWGIKGNTITSLRVAILQEKTKLNLQYLQEKSAKNLGKENKSINEIIVAVEIGLGKDYLDPEKISVSRWIQYCNELTKKVEYYKKNQKDGKRKN